ncbi:MULTISPECIES: translocation/assembly module TamB domain-containing protein [Ramlibacter]|uniref:Translocation/assembly module TamB domain-containing protein n=1 Tax=Ramlibacter aquaticus TaxID=2780094 RepID=A0ABR9SH23_9BURK|nr:MULTISPECIES: translocation/assembly module TamB domain-containing protein [Ramlibacter]MBE7941347.1 translocation/assembly module TamB domain-containing protein [Ramlibacter aquaticus]
MARAARLLRIAGLALAALVLLLAALVLGLWLWAGTQSSLDWTLRQAARSQGVSAEGVTGSLRTGLRARRLHWAQGGLAVDAEDVDLAWQPFALLHRQLHLSHLRAASLHIVDSRPPQPAAAPVALTLPLQVQVDELRVGQLEWDKGTQAVALTQVQARYRYAADTHDLSLAHLGWGGGDYQGTARLGARAPLRLAAQLQGGLPATVPGREAALPLRFTASVQGPLADLQASARIEGNAAAGGATATAHITPWAAQPLPQAQARLQDLDLSKLWRDAPATLLTGSAAIAPAGTATWTASADIANASPGPWDGGQLPVQALRASATWDGSVAQVREAVARLGGGELRAQGQWRREGRWSLRANIAGVDTAALHGRLARERVGGRVALDGEGGALGFDADLKAAGPVPAGPALALQSLQARGRWAGGRLRLDTLEARAQDATLSASGEAEPAARAGDGRLLLKMPGAQLQARGRVAPGAGAGELRLQAGDLAAALAWLDRLPGLGGRIPQALAAGRLEAQGGWRGGWRDPDVDARIDAAQLALRPSGAGPAWSLPQARATLSGRLREAAWTLSADAVQGARKASLQAQGSLSHGGEGSAWQGRLGTFSLAALDPRLGAGEWSLVLQQPVSWHFAPGMLDLGAGRAQLRPPPQARPAGAATLAWEPVHWGGGELRSAGRLQGLPLAWAELLGGPQLAGSSLVGDLVFDGAWDVQLGAQPRISASLSRSRGDVSLLAETAEGASARIAAGVREAGLTLRSEGERVSASLRWDSERGGSADGEASTRLERGGSAGWAWPAQAPVAGRLHARLPRIGVWSLLAPPGWRLRGSLAADVQLAGTRGEPQWSGNIAADDLALRSVADGVELQNGRLRARLAGQRLVLDEFLLHGPGERGGSLRATGEGHLGPNGPEAHMDATLDRLRASLRVDRQLTVSGQVAASRSEQGTRLSGRLRIDEAIILLPDVSTPKLGDDVTVRNAGGPITAKDARQDAIAARTPAQQLQVDLAVDLGPDFRLRGHGIDTRLAGELALAGNSLTAPRINGTIRAVGGEYEAYGQRLDIERGVLRFTGAADNPALDILAIRPNLSQRVGVMVTGTAFFPYVRLYAEPDLPDAEKLSWLVTGRPAPATGAESALVQQAALAFLAGRSGSGKGGIAASLGLDELSFRRDASEGPSITLGKRFGRNFYAAYERSLGGAMGTLSIFYDVTRNLTVRGQAGERSAVDLIYTLAFD